MIISIIIPTFNESTKIERDIISAAEFFEKNSFQGEIIIVDDGSTDNTSEAAENVKVPSDVSFRVIRYEKHRGKGYAVRTGIKSAKGDYILFADSGLCVPFDYILDGLGILKSGDFEIAHGSRKLKESIILKKQSLVRRIIAKMFRWIFIYWLKVPAELTDTQCGFKIYKGDTARKLYEQCVTDGFLFDIEIIKRAQKENYRIKEFPIEWRIDPDSRLSVRKNSIGVLKELIAMKKLLSEIQ